MHQHLNAILVENCISEFQSVLSAFILKLMFPDYHHASCKCLQSGVPRDGKFPGNPGFLGHFYEIPGKKRATGIPGMPVKLSIAIDFILPTVW